MLVDAAKHGDVEIPYFCYEPKLGQPVGACRMCLVEIEGIPKLQTSCSTPVRDGMVVNTTSDRVKHAQNAIVEFLLVNHPLDCPVCDKGGECPLQDISYGWGAGRSRFIEPKRHFKKPLELSPLIAIDRERCILCYRCVRFSQEIAEDYQLVFLERGDHTFVGTHDGRPYVAPFSGNIIELCPVGALTSTAYRFRAGPGTSRARARSARCARPSATSSSPSATTRRSCACSRATTTRSTTAGCATRAASATSRSAPERITRAAGARRRLPARGLVGARADEAAAALARPAPGRRARGRRRHQRGGLPGPAPAAQGLGSPHVDSRAAARPPEQARARAARPVRAVSPTSTTPGAILVLDTELVDEAPILDLRVRKAARRNGARLVVAPSRPRRSTPTPPPRCASRPAAPRPRSARWPPRSAHRPPRRRRLLPPGRLGRARASRERTRRGGAADALRAPATWCDLGRAALARRARRAGRRGAAGPGRRARPRGHEDESG